MSERATIFEGIQIGLEAVHGTAVAANRRLAAIGINGKPDLASSRYRPRGRKLDTLVVPGKRFTSGDIDGRATFDELIYPHASLLGKVNPTTPAGATDAREWLFSLASRGPDAYASYTVEQGSSVRAARFTHGVFTGLSMDINRGEITLGGSIIGQKWEEPITLTGSPTELGNLPFDPADASIYVDAAEADLGTTLMERCFAASWGLTDKYGGVWTVNRLAPSWATLVETPPDATLGLTFEADATGMGFLDVFEEGATRYVRFEVLGPEIEAGQNYLYQADFAAKVETVDPGDQEGVWGAAWNLRMVDDPDLAGLKVLIRNAVTAY